MTALMTWLNLRLADEMLADITRSQFHEDWRKGWTEVEVLEHGRRLDWDWRRDPPCDCGCDDSYLCLTEC